MIPGGHPTSMERQVAAETLAAALSPLSVRAIQSRLERILIDDRELLISLQCQLEQINDERILHALDGADRPISN